MVCSKRWAVDKSLDSEAQCSGSFWAVRSCFGVVETRRLLNEAVLCFDEEKTGAADLPPWLTWVATASASSVLSVVEGCGSLWWWLPVRERRVPCSDGCKTGGLEATAVCCLSTEETWWLAGVREGIGGE